MKNERLILKFFYSPTPLPDAENFRDNPESTIVRFILCFQGFFLVTRVRFASTGFGLHVHQLPEGQHT